MTAGGEGRIMENVHVEGYGGIKLGIECIGQMETE